MCCLLRNQTIVHLQNQEIVAFQNQDTVFDQKQDIQANSLAKEQLDTETFKAIMYEDAGAALIQRSKMDLKELEVRSKQLLDLQDVSRQQLEIKAYLQESKLDTKRTVDEIV